jgi:hypothetical protein
MNERVAPLPPVARAIARGLTNGAELRAIAEAHAIERAEAARAEKARIEAERAAQRATQRRRTRAWERATSGAKPESPSGVLTEIQATRARALAWLHGHWWAPIADTRDVAEMYRRHNAETCSSIAGEVPRFHGDVVVHTTSTGRARWAIWPDGRALVQITRRADAERSEAERFQWTWDADALPPRWNCIDPRTGLAADATPIVVAQATITPDGRVEREVGGVEAECRDDHSAILDGIVADICDAAILCERLDRDRAEYAALLALREEAKRTESL